MSTSTRSLKYACAGHCDLDGICSGHEVMVKYHHTSDTLTIYDDGREVYISDIGFLRALTDLHQEYEQE